MVGKEPEVEVALVQQLCARARLTEPRPGICLVARRYRVPGGSYVPLSWL
jgi:hypothetical protein